MNKILVSLLMLPLFTSAYAAGDAAAGESKTALCQGCHGATGNAATPSWPSLAGQHASYIEKQLADFKDGSRKNDTMAPMAMGLSKQDMADIAAYYETQKLEKNDAGASGEQIAKGKRIYNGGILSTNIPACASCHSGNGIGNSLAKYPALNGQNAAYIAQQMENFKDGSRANDHNSMMRDIASRMTSTEIEAVAAYLNNLD